MGFIKKGETNKEENGKEIRKEHNSDEIFIVPFNIREKVETFILKILYEHKSVKSQKELTERTLEKAAQERMTISEKTINLIINQMNKDEKIQFTQKDGWKIRI